MSLSFFLALPFPCVYFSLWQQDESCSGLIKIKFIKPAAKRKACGPPLQPTGVTKPVSTEHCAFNANSSGYKRQSISMTSPSLPDRFYRKRINVVHADFTPFNLLCLKRPNYLDMARESLRAQWLNWPCLYHTCSFYRFASIRAKSFVYTRLGFILHLSRQM